MELTNHAQTPTTAKTAIGDVRARVLAEHARIRIVVDDVDRLATAVSAGDFAKIELLRERAERLYRMLTNHIDHEESVLAPIIESIDAWGPVRLEQMLHDHAGQRMALKQAAYDLGVEGRPLGQAVQSMCWELLHDMKREEHDLLHPDLWRDSPIIVEISS